MLRYNGMALLKRHKYISYQNMSYTIIFFKYFYYLITLWWPFIL